jgi:hypothetical protein
VKIPVIIIICCLLYASCLIKFVSFFPGCDKLSDITTYGEELFILTHIFRVSVCGQLGPEGRQKVADPRTCRMEKSPG